MPRRGLAWHERLTPPSISDVADVTATHARQGLVGESLSISPTLRQSETAMIDSDDRPVLDAYVAAAERYFCELKDVRRLFAKPFVPLDNAGYNVARVGYLLHHLDHHRHHTVLDFGAGMCWLTSVVMHTGCQVIALDVSETALALGAEALALAHHPPGTPPAKLLTYDGVTIPLADASIDRVACFDAFHHVPNKRAVLTELHRVLRRGGRACFVEPGPGHADSAEARQEAHEWGVLEDEVDASALCALALEVGFESCYVVPLAAMSDNQLDPASFQRMRDGTRRNVLDCTGNDALIVVSKLPAGLRDSRSPGRLLADIEVLTFPNEIEPGQAFSAVVRVTNRGDTVWLALPPEVSGEPLDYAAAFLAVSPPGGRNTESSVEVYRRFLERHGLAGHVTVGVQLWPVGGGGAIDIDYARGFLPADVEPGTSVNVMIDMRAPSSGGPFGIKIDAVVELIAWFGDRGSPTQHRYLWLAGEAAERTTREPGTLRATLETVATARRGVVDVRISNVGDTVWLARPLEGGGWVRLGIQLLDERGEVLDRDWRRVDLPTDVRPGESLRVETDLSDAKALARSVKLDLVNELRSWFEDCGSQPLVVRL